MIREARMGDVDRLMEIWLAGNLEAHAFIDAQHWRRHADATKHALGQMGAAVTVLVYENALGIRGFLGLSDGYIEGIFVDKADRGQGIGKQLLAAAKGLCKTLTLHVYQKNADAMRFYLREGFWVQSTQRDPYTGEMECEMCWEKR